MLCFLVAAWLQLSLPAQALADNADSWKSHWTEVPAAELPAQAPEGDLKNFRLAVMRQMDTCRAILSGEQHRCPDEAAAVATECDYPTLRKILAVARKSGSWPELYARAKKEFVWYRYTPSAGGATDKAVMYTAYNAPLFLGSLRPDARFRYPLYGKPADLVSEKQDDGSVIWGRRNADGKLEPHFERKAIDGGKALAGKGLEIAYLEFPSDLLRLQIEGSGILRVPEGSGTADYVLNFSGKNGQPYRSVFKALKDQGVDPKYLSYDGLKAYFQEHPDLVNSTLAENPSYVFFSIGTEPPCGAGRTYITAGHSLAVDPTQLPLGMVALVDTEKPVRKEGPDGVKTTSQAFTRFALSQDTGGAIQGPHVDIYWGTDELAALYSNQFKYQGNLYLLRDRRLNGN